MAVSRACIHFRCIVEIEKSHKFAWEIIEGFIQFANFCVTKSSQIFFKNRSTYDKSQNSSLSDAEQPLQTVIFFRKTTKVMDKTTMKVLLKTFVVSNVCGLGWVRLCGRHASWPKEGCVPWVRRIFCWSPCEPDAECQKFARNFPRVLFHLGGLWIEQHSKLRHACFFRLVYCMVLGIPFPWNYHNYAARTFCWVDT